MFQALSQILNSDDLSFAWQALTQQMQKFGFDRMIYFRTHFHDMGISRPELQSLILSNHNTDYQDFFINGLRFQHSRFFQWASEKTGTISWDALSRYQVNEASLTVATEIQSKFREFGVKAGYAVSFKEIIPSHRSAFSICARSEWSQLDADISWSKHNDAIMAILSAFNLRAVCFPYPNHANEITERQAEILYWVAFGKTNSEIATILDISKSAVEKHLRNAREILNCETTTQAVTVQIFRNRLYLPTIDKDSDSLHELIK